MGILLYVFVVISTLTSQLSFGLEWTSSSLPDGSRVDACVGDTASFRWEYTTADDETVMNIEWYRTTQEGKTILATYLAGHLLKFPSITMTVGFLPNAGVEIGNFTWEDFTVYHVTVNYTRDDTFFSASRSVTLALPDAPILASNRLIAYMQPEPVTDVTTGQGHLQLSCGQFLNLGGRQISVIWRTPSGARVPSTSNTNGIFHLTLPNPVVGGSYKCQLKDPSLAARCVKNLSVLKRGAYVHVDKVDARLTLLWSRDERLTSEVGRLHEKLELQEETYTRVASVVSSIRKDVSRVDTQHTSDVTSLREDITSLREDATSQREDITSLREDNTSQREDITSLREAVTGQRGDITSLREDVTSQRKDITSLREDVTSQREDITSLREDVTSQRVYITRQREDITSLGEDFSRIDNQHSSDIASLREDMSSLREGLGLRENKQTQEMEKLRSELDAQKAVNGELTETVSNLRSVFQTLTDEAKSELKSSLIEEVKSTCASDVDNLQQQVSVIRDSVRSVRNDLERAVHQVFFHVYLSSHTGTDDPIIFNGVFYNVGGGYSTSTGYFTAPVSGTYLFMFSVVRAGSNSDDYTRVGLYVNGERMGYAYAESYATGSSHAVVHLSPGERAWTSGTISDINTGDPSTFSGVLIQADT